jgi:streptomycin 6-kinase
VLSGKQGSQDIILKVGLDFAGLRRESAALQAFKNYGAVTILNEQDGALLLKHVLPGNCCVSTKDKRTIEITCDVMERLHQAPLPDTQSFPHVQDWLSLLDKDWQIPPHCLEKSRKLKDILQYPSEEIVLLHGDLHFDNILKNGDDWAVIDPKGVLGHPINEVWTFIVDMEKDTKYIAERFNFSLQSVRQWYFVHLVLAACWNIEDHASPQLFIDLALKTYPWV